MTRQTDQNVLRNSTCCDKVRTKDAIAKADILQY